MSNVTDHSGRRYVVVGGTAGMGAAAAALLASAGARTTIIGRNAERAATKAAAMGGNVAGEGSDKGGLDAAIHRSADRMGGIDGLAVTAGPMASQGSLLELTDEQWSEMFETQLMTTVRSLRAAIPLLKANGGGNIVTTAAYSVRAQKENLPHYAAMKTAVASVSKNAAKFHGKDNIRVNCIAPGAVATDAMDPLKAMAVAEYGGDPMAALNRMMIEKWGMKVATNRVGEPREIGELIAFLLSPAAAFMTGALINIDGGTDF